MPNDQLLQKIIKAGSIGSNNFASIGQIVWRRVLDNEHPRHVYKGLYLLKLLLQHGSNRTAFMFNAKARRAEIAQQAHFRALDPQSLALSGDIRQTAAAILDLIDGKTELPLEDMLEAKKQAKIKKARGQPRDDQDSKRKSVDLSAAAPIAPGSHQRKHSKHHKKHKKHKSKSISKSTSKNKVSQQSSGNATSAAIDPWASGASDDDDDSEFDKISVTSAQSSRQRAHSTDRKDENASGHVETAMDFDALASRSSTRQKSAGRRHSVMTPSEAASLEDIFAMAPVQQPPQPPMHNHHRDQSLDFLSSSQSQPSNANGTNSFVAGFATQPVPTQVDPQQQQLSGLLGDMAHEFNALDPNSTSGAAQNLGQQSYLFPEYNQNNFNANYHVPEPQPFVQPKQSPAPAPVVVPVQAPVPVRQRVPPRRQLNPAFVQELAAYARFINTILQENGLDPNDPNLIDCFADGLIVAEVINAVQPDTVDNRALNCPVTDEKSRLENASLVVRAAQSLGIRVDTTDIKGHKNARQLLNILSQLCKMVVLRNVSLKAHPELSVLADDNSEESIGKLMRMHPAALLIRWMQYHIDQSDIERSSLALSDSVCYGIISNAVCCSMPPEDFGPAPLDVNILMQQPDLKARADVIIDQANAMGVQFPMSAEDIMSGNKRLNLMFTASLFNVHSGISSALLAGDEDQVLETVEAFEKATLLEEETDAGETREERAYRMWINSQGLDNVVIHNLFDDFADGVTALRVIEAVQSGTVDWKQVRIPPQNKFQLKANCDYAVSLGAKLGLSIVNIRGDHFVQRNRKYVLAFVWQLMRFHVLKYLRQVRSLQRASDSKSRDDDSFILMWANNSVAQAYARSNARRGQTAPRLRSFADSSAANGLFLIDLLWAIEPRVVDWRHVTEGNDADQCLLNARYAVSIARKLGAVIFLLPEDIVEVRSRMILTFVTGIMMLQREQTHSNSN
jgi:plastin-1